MSDDGLNESADEMGKAKAAEAASSPGETRRRAPATIELKQSEYSSSAGGASSDASTADPSETAGQTQGAHEPGSESPKDETSPKPQDKAARASRGAWPIVTGAAGGALAAIVIAGALAWSGLFAPAPPPPGESPSDLAARLARLEQVASAPKPETPAPADPVLPARVSSLEQSAQSAREGLDSLRRQVEALSSALVEVKTKVAALETEATARGGVESAPAPDVAPAPESPPQISADDLQTIRARIEALGKRLDEADAKAQTPPSAAAAPAPDILSDARLKRFALALALDVQMRRGLPYQAQLDEATKASESTIAGADALAGFAASGLPSVRALADGMLAIVADAANVSAPAPAAPASPDDLLGRLSQRAARLVKIERTDAPSRALQPGVPPEFVASLQRGDLEAALKNIDGLPDSLRGAAQDWAARVRARQAALDASNNFLQNAIAPFRRTSASN